MADYTKEKIGIEDFNLGEGTFLRKNSLDAYDELEQINLKDIFDGSGENITGIIDWFYDINDYTSINNAVTTIDDEEGVLLITSDQDFTAADTVPSTLTMWIFPGVTVSISDDVTISGNVIIEKGAKFSIDSGKILTVTNLSSIKVQPSQQWISGDGTLSVTNQDCFGYAEAFGVDGTDDHTEINKAIAAFKRVKLLGDTTYVIDDSIELEDDSELIGEGWTSVIKAESGFSDIMISNEDVDRVILRNFKVDGNGESCSGLSFTDGTDNSDDVIIENIWFDYLLDNVIYIAYPRRCKIINNKITRFGAVLTDGDAANPATDCGIYLTKPEECHVCNNYIDNSDLITAQHTDNQTYGRDGIRFHSGAGERNKIIGNTIITVERCGIVFISSSDVSIISNNHIYDAGEVGIYAYGDDVIVNGNYCKNCGENGIRLYGSGASTHIVCDGNIVISCGDNGLTGYNDYELAGILTFGTASFVVSNNASSLNGNDGIELRGTCGTCTGNSCYDNDVNGIEVSSGNWVLNNNYLNSNDEDGIEIEDSITDFTIVGNICISNGADGIEVGSNTVGIIGGNHCVSNTSSDQDISSSFAGMLNGNSILSNGGGLQILTKTTEITGMSGATETWTNAIPAGSFPIGVSGRVTTLITGASSFDIGDGSNVDLFGDAIGLAAGTTIDLSDSDGTLPAVYTTDTDIVLTANVSNFTAGAVRLVLSYIQLTSPYT